MATLSKLVFALALAGASLSAGYAENGKPEYGTWGYDAAGGDPATKPGDNFFRFANGAWLDKTEIPGDKPGYSLRLAMTDRVEARLHDMIEAASQDVGHAPQDLPGKIGAFYKSFMDEAAVEQRGVGAIEPELKAIRDAATRDDLARLMGRAAADFESTLFGFYIDVDLKDPTKYAFYLSQGGLGLPDRDYYLKDDFKEEKAAYARYVGDLLKLIAWPDAENAARSVVELETKVADASWAKAEQRDPVALYNPMSVDELASMCAGFGWKDFLIAANMPGLDHVIVGEKSAFPKLCAIFSEAALDTLKAWQAFHVADNAAPYLSKAFVDAYFELHDKTMAGQKEQQTRWKRAITAVGGGDFIASGRFGSFGTMGFGVGQLYSEKYFPPASKAKIEALVANLKAAFHARIEHLDWMSEETKKQALEKLETYTIKVGYPDTPRDYGALVVYDDDLIGNVRRAAELDWTYYSQRFAGPVDKGEWFMTPQTNDAYNGSLRDIVFPAGILQPPMFDPDADPAINYGAIGGVIGHELTHGFDDQGRKIDASGALRDWWTPEDAKKFEERAKVLGEQYSAFEPIAGVHVNGDLTMGENIADLGGLTLALDAYHASLGGKPAPVIDGFTGDQRVFLGWAQAWRGKVTEDYVKRQVVSDPHSPRQFRVIGPTRNIDAWYDAFDVQPGEQNYIDPKNRVHIW